MTMTLLWRDSIKSVGMKPVEKQADLLLGQCSTKSRLDQLDFNVACVYSFRLCTSNCYSTTFPFIK